MGEWLKGLLDQEVRKKIFMAAFLVYLAELIVFSSMYAKIEPLQRFFALVRVTAYLLVCCKLLLDLLAKTFSWKEMGIVGLISLLMMWTAHQTGRKAILIYWIFIVAAHDIEFQKLIKWSCLVHVVSMGFVFASRYAGVIEDRVYSPWGRARDSIGFQYTTEGSNFFLYTILMWIYWRKEKISWLELIGLGCGNFFLFNKTDTKSAFALGCVAFILAAVLKVSNYLRTYHKLYGVAAVGVVPALAYGIFELSIHYRSGKKWMEELNRLLSSRLTLGKAGYWDYGVQLWGRRIEWIGGTNEFEDFVKSYNYVDSSFLQILLQCGLVFLLFLIGVFMALGVKTAIRRDTYFVLVLIIFAVHSTFDPQIIWMEFNSFVMLYSYFYWKGEKTFYFKRLIHDVRKNHVLAGIGVLLFALIFTQIGIRKVGELQVREEVKRQKEKTYEWTLEESDKQMGDVKANIMLTERQVEKLQRYVDQSSYMELDGQVNYVADVQYELQTEANVGNILNSLAFYINQGGLQEDIARQHGSEAANDCREVISCAIQEPILYVAVTDRDEKKAQENLVIVKENLEKEAAVIAGIQGEFSLIETASAVNRKEDAGIGNMQQSHRDNLENYKKNDSDLKDNLANMQKNWENYEEGNRPEQLETMIPNPMTVVQYAVVGVLWGAMVLGVGWMLKYTWIQKNC